MKKWIYKLIFSILIVPLILFMLPKKEVKAQQQEEFAPMLIRATFVSSFYDVETDNTYVFVNTYRLDNIIIENLSRTEYFFTTRKFFSFNHTTYTSTTNSYMIEYIQIEDNSTMIYLRIALSSARVNQYYGGVENRNEWFSNDTAFYVSYDVYNAGFNAGYDAGYSSGSQDGYNDGYNDGYMYGRNDGYNVGKQDGYNEGYNDGLYASEGYQTGYDDGHADGYEEGKEYGMSIGREHWYDVGYEKGYNKGLAARNFSDLLKSMFGAIGVFLGINLLPGISIGALIAVPIIFGIIAFILGRRRD